MNDVWKVSLMFVSVALAFGACKKVDHPCEVIDVSQAPSLHIDADLVRLADTMETWLGSVQLSNGLLETSYNSNVVSLYDNALAALVFIETEEYERARLLFTFFNDRLQTEMLSGNGGFFQFRNASGQPQGNRWLGDNAWLLIALNNYAHSTGDMQFQPMQMALQQWIINQQDTDGSLWGGTDITGAFLPKVTEAMIDAFNAVPGYLSFHENLLGYLEADRWDAPEQLLVSWPGSNYYYALDNFSWGYCTFEGLPMGVLDAADRFKTVQFHALSADSIGGYCFDEDRDAVWAEGSAQMAVAFIKAGRISEANAVLHELQKMATAQVQFSGAVGLPYASNVGTHYGGGALWSGADEQPCTAANTWFIMACHQFDPMQLNYTKSIPADVRFW